MITRIFLREGPCASYRRVSTHGLLNGISGVSLLRPQRSPLWRGRVQTLGGFLPPSIAIGYLNRLAWLRSCMHRSLRDQFVAYIVLNRCTR